MVVMQGDARSLDYGSYTLHSPTCHWLSEKHSDLFVYPYCRPQDRVRKSDFLPSWVPFHVPCSFQIE